MSFIKCQWWSQDFRHSPDGNLSRVNPFQSRIKSIIITASSIGLCAPISSTPSKLRAISIEHLFVCPYVPISSNPHVPAVASAAPSASCEQSASSISSYVLAVPSTSSKHPASYVLAVHPRTKNRSSAAGVDL